MCGVRAWWWGKGCGVGGAGGVGRRARAGGRKARGSEWQPRAVQAAARARLPRARRA